MKKLLLAFTIILSSFWSEANAQKQYEVDGVIIPRTIEFEGKKLQLNGFGTRSKLWTEVYIQALYVSTLSDNAEDINNSDTNMAIRLQVTSSLVSSKTLSKSLQKGLAKSIGEKKLSEFQSQIDLLEKLLTSEEIQKNDNFNLIYTPLDNSIWLYKNNRLEGKIPGFEFKKAFFGIWLGSNPVDLELKNSLLGK